MDPFTGSLILGGAQSILGVLGGAAESAAAQQDHMNQVAFQNANTAYARWQAGFNQRVNNANAEYQYWQQTVNYNQSLAYSRSMANYEMLREIAQAEVVGRTRAAAGADFGRRSEAISQAAAEMSMREAVAQQQYTVAALKARGRAMASDQEGNSIDRLMKDYARQVGDYQTIQSINQGLRNRQYSREQAAALADYLSKYNSQSFYEAQPQMEPIAPFAPLPALLEAPAPTMTGSGPSGAAAALRIGSGLMSGVSTGFNTYIGLKGVTSPKPKG
jgi:hypothetical protein